MAAVPREKNIPIQPAGYVLVPAATIGGLSMILAGGLDLLGFLGRMNAGIARGVSRGQAENFPQRLPEAAIWLAAGLFAFGLAAGVVGDGGVFGGGVGAGAQSGRVFSRHCRALDRHPVVRRVRAGLRRQSPHGLRRIAPRQPPASTPARR
jgi:hypothetical protein